MRSLWFVSAISLLTLAAAAGCGGDDGDSDKGSGATGGASAGTGGSSQGNTGGSVSSGLPDSAVIGALPPDQLDAFCKELAPAEVQAQLNDFLCRYTALFTAAFTSTDEQARAACQGAYDQCVATPSTSTAECTEPRPDCTATVGEARACLAELPSVISAVNSALPACKDLTRDKLEALDPSPPDAPACTTFQEKCKGIVNAGTTL